MSELTCKYCGKTGFKSPQALGGHMARCPARKAKENNGAAEATPAVEVVPDEQQALELERPPTEVPLPPAAEPEPKLIPRMPLVDFAELPKRPPVRLDAPEPEPEAPPQPEASPEPQPAAGRAEQRAEPDSEVIDPEIVEEFAGDFKEEMGLPRDITTAELIDLVCAIFDVEELTEREREMVDLYVVIRIPTWAMPWLVMGSIVGKRLWKSEGARRIGRRILDWIMEQFRKEQTAGHLEAPEATQTQPEPTAAAPATTSTAPEPEPEAEPPARGASGWSEEELESFNQGGQS